MSTKMDEDDWAHTLAVFRACLPRRGRRAEDDRRFLEALHFFTVENVRWRALPERFGHWNSVWKRFDRLSKAGVFEACFDTLASMSSTAHLIQMFDATIVRAHVSAAARKGEPGEAEEHHRPGRRLGNYRGCRRELDLFELLEALLGCRGRYNVQRLMDGDEKILYLLSTLTNCPKTESADIYDRCKARYEGLTTR
jgi:transposase